MLELIDVGGASIEFQDQNMDMPLVLASKNDRIHCVRLLLNRGANMGARAKFGGSALIWAACLSWYSSTGCVRLLLDAWANREARDKEGDTALTAHCCFWKLVQTRQLKTRAATRR